MLLKPKIIFVLGCIACGKTTTAKQLTDRFDGIYVDNEQSYVAGKFVEGRLLEEVIRVANQNPGRTIVVDAWFEWGKYWWLKTPEIESLKSLRLRTSRSFDFVIVDTPAEIIMKRIKENPTKYQYPNYEKEIPLIYIYLNKCIAEWEEYLKQNG